MTHGWPGSVIELLETVGPLTDPTAHGGRAEDAFDLGLPSLPGYGLSGEPTEVGWDPGRVARAWAELMHRLGYTRYVAQGGGRGRLRHRRDGPPGAEGAARHPHQLARDRTGRRRPPGGLRRGTRRHRGARNIQGEWLRLLPGAGHAAADDRLRLLDSPVALAAWMLDHDTDSYEKITRAFVDGQPAGNLSRDHIVDNITMYWLTGTGASAARSYWESGRAQAMAAAAGQAPPEVSIPTGFTTFPGEIFRAPRSWVEQGYSTSPTSTKSTRAATSPPGRSRNSSPRKSARRSPPCDSDATKAVPSQ